MGTPDIGVDQCESEQQESLRSLQGLLLCESEQQESLRSLQGLLLCESEQQESLQRALSNVGIYAQLSRGSSRTIFEPRGKEGASQITPIHRPLSRSLEGIDTTDTQVGALGACPSNFDMSGNRALGDAGANALVAVDKLRASSLPFWRLCRAQAESKELRGQQHKR